MGDKMNLYFLSPFYIIKSMIYNKKNKLNWHILSNINDKKRTADCSICGKTNIQSRGFNAGSKFKKWRCGKSKKKIIILKNSHELKVSYSHYKRYGEDLLIEIYEKYKYQCNYCGTTNNLSIHHIDGKGIHYEKLYGKPNNKINNLILLCRKCHGNLHSQQYGMWRNFCINLIKLMS